MASPLPSTILEPYPLGSQATKMVAEMPKLVKYIDEKYPDVGKK